MVATAAASATLTASPVRRFPWQTEPARPALTPAPALIATATTRMPVAAPQYPATADTTSRELSAKPARPSVWVAIQHAPVATATEVARLYLALADIIRQELSAKPAQPSA